MMVEGDLSHGQADSGSPKAFTGERQWLLPGSVGRATSGGQRGLRSSQPPAEPVPPEYEHRQTAEAPNNECLPPVDEEEVS